MSEWWTQLVVESDLPLIALAAIALALVAAAHGAASWWIARRARMEVDASRARRWLIGTFEAVIPPLALVAWIHGLAFVLLLLLPRAMPPRLADPALVGVGWAYRAGIVAGLIWLLARLGRLAERFLTVVAARTAGTWDDLLLPLAGKAVRRGLPLLGLMLARPLLPLPPALDEVAAYGVSLLLILLVSYLAYEMVDAAAAFVLQQHRVDVTDNLRARSIYTQVTVLKKVAVAAIGVFTLASALMVFESVRQFGASILASAGIAGVIVGFAAQRSIATLLAGFQIALTQPIRLDDVVIVEGEWGRIEDITLTYVVIRIWDQRRLVVPINHFIEQPFQNWTRSSAEILGTVFLHVDYTLPIEAVRNELTRILEKSPHWDGRVNVVHVTEAREHTLEVRALVSASDASRAWDLRCEVREKLVAFVQRVYPESLPRMRASLDPPPPLATGK
ncbi:MAG: mechanosensitive ion channel family protein [Vicinamibacterales bacterium]